MHRRTYLRSLAASGLTAGLAGCSNVGGGNPDVTLAEPDRSFESGDVNYPAWGERVPDVTLSAPLDDREVSVRAVDRPSLLTFFYSSCETTCPLLVQALRSVQTHAAENGYADGVTFLPITFDPERDDAERLRAYADEQNVDADASNWHFLRPSPDRVQSVVTDQFGVAFQREDQIDGGATPTEGGAGTPTAGATPTPAGTATDGDGTPTDGNGTPTDGNGTPTDGGHAHGDGYAFVHSALTLLVNADGYVERAYRTKTPNSEAIIADLAAVNSA